MYERSAYMKHIGISFIMVMVLLCSTTAREVMKITYEHYPQGTTYDLVEENLSDLSRVVFTDEDMKVMVGSTPAFVELINFIEKIEFYEDNYSSMVGEKDSDNSLESMHFSVNNSELSLSLPESTDLSVSLYNVMGRRVAKLYKGHVDDGTLNLNIAKKSVATGVYSLVVKSDSALFVRKVMVK